MENMSRQAKFSTIRFACSFLLTVLLMARPSCQGRILYLSFPQFSHIQMLTCMEAELSQYGHELWLAAPEKLSNHPALKGKNIIKMGKLGDIDIEKEFFAKVADAYLNPESVNQSQSVKSVIMDTIFGLLLKRKPNFDLFSKTREIVNDALSDQGFIAEIKEKNFDLMVVDCGLGMGYSIIPYRLDVPFVYLSVLQKSWQAGSPTLPSFVPVSGIGVTDRMNFTQRLFNVFFQVFFMIGLPIMPNSDIADYAPEKEAITVNQLMSLSKMWFIAQDVLVDFPRPLMPHEKLVGGMCAKPAKPLDKQFRDFCDKSKNGVVIVSFGGSVKNLQPKLSDKLLKAFSMTKYDFIWRSNLTLDDGKKILTKSWLPQNDLLAHPKIKLFVTHGGSNGIFESVYNGVPMLLMPIFAEQPKNAERMENKGFGITMDFHDNTAEELADAITTIIETPAFKANIKMASDIFRNRPLTSQMETAYWLDYVIRYGDSYIRPSGLDLPWYQYLCLDILLFLSVVIIVVLYVTFKILFCCVKCCCCRRSNLKKKKD